MLKMKYAKPKKFIKQIFNQLIIENNLQPKLRISTFSPSIFTLGSYNKEKNILTINLDNIKLCSRNSQSAYLWGLLKIIYHEYNHVIEYNQTISNPNRFLIQLEDYIIKNNPNYYNKYHHDFHIEITANQYALAKIIQKINTTSNLKEYTNSLLPYIELYSILMQIQYQNYDIELVINGLKSINSNKLQQLKEVSKYVDLLINEVPNKHNSKKLEDLLVNETWLSLSLDIQYKIITTKYYLDKIIKSIATLNFEELEYLTNACIYKLKLEETKLFVNNTCKKQLSIIAPNISNDDISLTTLKEEIKTNLAIKEELNKEKINYLKSILSIIQTNASLKKTDKQKIKKQSKIKE